MKEIEEILEERLDARIANALRTLSDEEFRDTVIELLGLMELRVTGAIYSDDTVLVEGEGKEGKYLVMVSRRAADASSEGLRKIKEKAELEGRRPALIVLGDFDEDARQLATDNQIAYADQSRFLSLVKKFGIGSKLLKEIDRRILEQEGARYLPSIGRFDAVLGAAEEAMRQKNYEKALVHIEEALRLKPDHFVAWQKKAIALAEIGRNEKAVEACRKAIELKPDDAYSWYLLGVFLGRLSDFKGELAAYDNALRLSPAMRPVLLNKGAALYQLGMFDEALKVYELMLKSYPGDAQALNNRGLVLKALGRLTDALHSFELAIKSDPKNLEALINRASLLSEFGSVGEAVDAWQEVVRVEGGKAELWLNLGRAQKAAGLFDDAAKSFGVALVLNPSLSEAVIERDEALAAADMTAPPERKRDTGIAREFLNAAIILRAMGRPEEALMEVEKCLKIEPLTPEAHRLRGELLLDLGRFEEALISIKESVREIPGDVFNLLDLEAVTYRLGKKEECLRILEGLHDSIESDARRLLLLLEMNRLERLDISLIKNETWIMRELRILLLIASGNYGKAVEEIEEIVAKGEITPELMNNLGVCYRLLGDFERSAKAFRDAISLAPAYADAWNNLGCVNYLQADYAQALKCFEEALLLEKRPSFHLNKGICQLAIDDLEGASDSFTSALRIEQSADALNCLGIVAERKKEFIKALELYNAAIEKNPKFHDAIANRDRVLSIVKEGKK
ncbi:MAG: tetratricopeptide repeat protein [Methanomassiliicoccales archaeon]|jgi:tetratricopeptide (TPR) repeat protein|nr:tetratricopeptide repeat protein [Methanomassiliicoccales archaeon]